MGPSALRIRLYGLAGQKLAGCACLLQLRMPPMRLRHAEGRALAGEKGALRSAAPECVRQLLTHGELRAARVRQPADAGAAGAGGVSASSRGDHQRPLPASARAATRRGRAAGARDAFGACLRAATRMDIAWAARQVPAAEHATGGWSPPERCRAAGDVASGGVKSSTAGRRAAPPAPAPASPPPAGAGRFRNGTLIAPVYVRCRRRRHGGSRSCSKPMGRTPLCGSRGA